MRRPPRPPTPPTRLDYVTSMRSPRVVSRVLDAIGEERRRDCLLIALAWVAIALVVRPFQDTPFIDDWVYAWSVERLLLHHELKVMDYSTSVNVVQTLWGALFCLPAGFSFTALRISTWAAALLCLWTLYLLLRDFQIPRRDAVLGVATLALNPLFFVLSISFMTDIPFLACMTAALLAFSRAVSMERIGWLWAASLLAALSMGIRLTGTALPIAMALALLARPRSWGRRCVRFLVPLSAFVVMAGVVAWHGSHVQHIADLSEVPNAPQNRLISARLYAIPTLPQALIGSTMFLTAALGLTLLPLTIAWQDRRRLATTAAICAALWLGAITMQLAGAPHYPPLSETSTWRIAELGMAEVLVPNAMPFVQPPWLSWSITLITLASGAAVLTTFVRRPRTIASISLAWFAFGSVLFVAVLWLFFDRYALPFVPLAIISLLTRGPLQRPRATAAVLVLFGMWSFFGVRDHLHYNAAVWRAVDQLRRAGVPPSEIDGGYVVNGWLQYAHPDQAARDTTGKVAVPMMNVGGTLPYQISNSPMPGRKLIATVPYTRWLGRSGHIYVLEHEPSAE